MPVPKEQPPRKLSGPRDRADGRHSGEWRDSARRRDSDLRRKDRGGIRARAQQVRAEVMPGKVTLPADATEGR